MNTDEIREQLAETRERIRDTALVCTALGADQRERPLHSRGAVSEAVDELVHLRRRERELLAALAEAKPPASSEAKAMTCDVELTDGELLGCADASIWAREFCKKWRRVVTGQPPPDEGWMLAWFANAMMAMHDFVERKHEARAPTTPAKSEAQDTLATCGRRWRWAKSRRWAWTSSEV